MGSGDEWVRTTAAAEMLGVPRHTLYKMLNEGQIVGYRFGRLIRLRRSDVQRFQEAANAKA
jgi:excisionase family DNA binding protein